MNSFVGFKNFTQGILFIVIIILGVVFVGFIIISIIGNVQLGCSSKEIKAPDIDEAKFRMDVKATRKSYYTDHYELVDGKVYILHGYWEPRNGKFAYRSGKIQIDPHYWGEVKITER